MLMPAYHVQVHFYILFKPRQGTFSVEGMSSMQRHCTPSDQYCLQSVSLLYLRRSGS